MLFTECNAVQVRRHSCACEKLKLERCCTICWYTGLCKKSSTTEIFIKCTQLLENPWFFLPDFKKYILQFILPDMVEPKLFNAMFSKTPVFKKRPDVKDWIRRFLRFFRRKWEKSCTHPCLTDPSKVLILLGVSSQVLGAELETLICLGWRQLCLG